jgi:hypothetical protein
MQLIKYKKICADTNVSRTMAFEIRKRAIIGNTDVFL